MEKDATMFKCLTVSLANVPTMLFLCYISLYWNTEVPFIATSLPGFASKPVCTSSNHMSLYLLLRMHWTSYFDCILEWWHIVVRYVHSSSWVSQSWLHLLQKWVTLPINALHPTLIPLSLGAAQCSAVGQGQHICKQSCQVKTTLNWWSQAAWLIAHKD